MVELLMVRINDKISPSIIQQDVLPTLSVERQERVRKYRREEDARRSIVAEMLIRTIAMDKLKLSNKEIVFGATAYQKPYLIHEEPFHYNLSHSGEWVVCAANDSPVGADVEQIKPIDYEVARRFFSPSEYAGLMNRPEEERLPFFYRLWTLKESYIKAVGQGLSIPLNSFSCRISETSGAALIEAPGQLYYLRTYSLDQYMVSVCAMRDNFARPMELQEEALIRRYLNLLNR